MNPFEVYPTKYIKEEDNDPTYVKNLTPILDSYTTLAQQSQAEVANCLSYAIGRVRCLSMYLTRDRRDTWTTYKDLVKAKLLEEQTNNQAILPK